MCSSRKPSLFAQMMQKLPEVQVTDPSSVPSDCRFGTDFYSFCYYYYTKILDETI